MNMFGIPHNQNGRTPNNASTSWQFLLDFQQPSHTQKTVQGWLPGDAEASAARASSLAPRLRRSRRASRQRAAGRSPLRRPRPLLLHCRRPRAAACATSECRTCFVALVENAIQAVAERLGLPPCRPATALKNSLDRCSLHSVRGCPRVGRVREQQAGRPRVLAMLAHMVQRLWVFDD